MECRVPTPSVLELQDNETIPKNLVQFLIVQSVSLDKTDPQCLIRFLRRLETACQSFDCASKALVKYLMFNGKVSEANELRKARYSILRSDAQECIDSVDGWLSNFNIDGFSNRDSVAKSYPILMISAPPAHHFKT